MARVQMSLKQDNISPQLKNSSKSKKSNFLHGLFAVIVALMIIILVFGSVFYVIIHNNINGFGEKYRTQIKNIPVIRHALPSVPDPEDPKYLTDGEIRSRYMELRVLRDQLEKELEEAGREIEDLRRLRDEKEKIDQDNEKMKVLLEEQKSEIEAQRKQLEEDLMKAGELIANADKEGLKEYFQKIDKDTAEILYKQILTEEKASAEARKFAQYYENMEPKNAARIFKELGEKNIDLIVEILTNMRKEISSQVLSEMDADFAAKITQALSLKFLNEDGTEGLPSNIQ